MASNNGVTYAAVINAISSGLNLPNVATNFITVVGNTTSSTSIFPTTFKFTLSSYGTDSATIYTVFTPDGSALPSAVAVIPVYNYTTFTSRAPSSVASVSSGGLQTDPPSSVSSVNVGVATLATGSVVTLTSTSFVSSSSSRVTASATTTTSPSSSQSSSAATSATTPPSHHPGFPSGAIAGIVIGCVVLVAGIIAFVWFRRRRRNRNSRSPYANEARVAKTDGESYKLATSTVTSRSRQLPQPESDQTISRLANRTLDDIELFVEHYYVDRSVKATEINATNMLPFSSPYLGSPLADIVRKSSHPTGIFKHCIAYYLLQKIDPAHNNSMSLLPKHFIMPAKGDRRALSQRRVEIAHSRPDIAEDKDYLLQRDRATEEIIQQIERAFQPWARGNTRERAKNLNGTLAHLSELGQKLFAQPATFEWRWRLPNREQTVMLPGLDKLTDSEAVTLATPIRLVQPRTGVQ